MARNAAAFLSAKLRHAQGLPVEGDIAGSCIDGVKETAETAAKFQSEGAGVSISVTRHGAMALRRSTWTRSFQRRCGLQRS
ncbi:MAG TPA: hypothetical protein VLE70_17135 [Anaerolineae bacterium]|nr:hypothetical protein [Anaerolineae bacterium]